MWWANMGAVAIGVLVGGCALLCVVHSGRMGRDDTDPPDGVSGLVIYTDFATGVQYVGGALGGLTPRLDARGQVMVHKE